MIWLNQCSSVWLLRLIGFVNQEDLTSARSFHWRSKPFHFVWWKNKSSFFSLCQYGSHCVTDNESPGDAKPYGMKMGEKKKSLPAPRGKFLNKTVVERQILILNLQYCFQNIHTGDNEEALYLIQARKGTTSTIYPFWVPVKRAVVCSIHIRRLSEPL